MSQIQVTPEVALRETMIKLQWAENRVMVLAQQSADKDRRIAELEAAAPVTDGTDDQD